jgi:folate-binding protein YgfZ
MAATLATLVTAPRPRACVGAKGPDAESYLNRMLSNDLAAVPVQGSCDALLLTAKARVIAPVRLVRRAVDDFLLLTEPELGTVLRSQLLRARFAARVEIAEEQHTVTLVLGEGWAPPAGSIAAACPDYGVPGWEVIDTAAPEGARAAGPDELERLRIVARTPRFGAEVDDRVMPAEAGLVAANVDFAKGCYPGQEPIARLHYRGHANRGLRALVLDGGAGAGVGAGAGPAAALPAYDAPVRLDGKEVGRVTSAVAAGAGDLAVGGRDGAATGGVLVLAYVREEVPEDAVLEVAGVPARQLPRS